MPEVTVVKGYFVHAPTSERTSGRVKGPYSSWRIANMECERAGWYDSPGEVQEAWFMQLDNGVIFEYDPDQDLKFVDLQRDEKKEMIEKIKSKLSESEIEFLNLK